MVKAHTLQWKKKEARELKELIKSSKVIAVARIERFPASLFQKIRKALSGKATIRVSKTRVFSIALKESGIDASALTPFIEGPIAIIFTEMDPFELYMQLKKNRGKMAAKPGMTAEKDIIVYKGDTGLPPGPDLADLKAAGLKPQMKGSSIKIPEDVTLVRKGETVTEAHAKALSKLDIKPVEVGLDVTAALMGGEIFEAGVLDIDLEKTFANIANAYRNALCVSVETAYPVPENIAVLIGKAFNESRAVSLEACILNSCTAGAILARAQAQASALKGIVKEEPAPQDAQAEAEPQEPATEEKPAPEAEKPAAEAEKTPSKKPAEKAAGKKEEKKE